MAASNQNQYSMIEDDDAQIECFHEIGIQDPYETEKEQLIAKVAAMSEKQLWSRRDQVDCDIGRYGYMEYAGFELHLIEDEIERRKT